jgi:hypothetical protein
MHDSPTTKENDMNEAMDRAERTIRNEGEGQYFYIDPNQFKAEDERTEMATRDPEVDNRFDTENEACEVALRLANYFGSAVTVSKYVKSGALDGNFEEAADESITIQPQRKAA